MKLLADIEGNDLLPAIDRIWCICFEDYVTKQTWDFTPDNLDQLIRFLIEKQPEQIIFHNGIGFDLPALKKVMKIDYSIEPDTLLGFPCVHVDTLILSKLLNPDREGGHSLEEWGKRLGMFKGSHSDWSQFSPKMLTYCRQDVNVLRVVYETLFIKEFGHV